MAVYRVDIAPMGAVRMTQRGKYTNRRAQAYLAHKNFLKWHFNAQHEGEPIDTPVVAEVIFYMPIPKSWSNVKKSRAMGAGHISKPDIDNLVKTVFDAANGIIWSDDNRVISVTARKIYSDTPGVKLKVQPK